MCRIVLMCHVSTISIFKGSRQEKPHNKKTTNVKKKKPQMQSLGQGAKTVCELICSDCL